MRKSAARALLVTCVLVGGALLRIFGESLDHVAHVARSWLAHAPASGSTASTRHARPARGGLRGSVSNVHGAAVQGAQVCITCSSYLDDRCARDSVEPQCTSTDEDGGYSLRNLAMGEYAVAATKAGVAYGEPSGQNRVRLRSRAFREGVDITLTQAISEVHGVTVDARGQPVADARVRAVYVGRGGGFAGHTRTNGEGAFSMWVASGRTVTWEATAHGHATGRLQRTPPVRDIRLVLPPEARLSGRVVSQAGRPVPNARVRASPGRFLFDMPEDVFATSDSEGRFELRGLASRSYWLVANTQAEYGENQVPIAASIDGRSPDVFVPVAPAVSVTGSVVIGDADAPCPEGTVTLRPFKNAEPSPAPASPFSHHRGSAAQARLDSLGHFEFPTVIAGIYDVGVRCTGYRIVRGPGRLRIGQDDISALTWFGERGLSHTVRVADAKGRPASGIGVMVAASVDRRKTRSGKTDSAGEHAFGGLAPGKYEVAVQSPHRVEPVTFDVDDAAPTGTTTVQLPGCHTLSVTVAGDDGRPVSGLRVYATARSTVEPNPWSEMRAEETGGGHYRIRFLRAGAYGVHASDLRNSTVTKAVEIGNRDDTHVTLILPNEAGMIWGTVLDSDARPVANAWVGAVEQSVEVVARRMALVIDTVHGERRTLTDEQGRFTLLNVASGRPYTVRAERDRDGVAVIERGVRAGVPTKLELPTQPSHGNLTSSARESHQTN